MVLNTPQADIAHPSLVTFSLDGILRRGKRIFRIAACGRATINVWGVHVVVVEEIRRRGNTNRSPQAFLRGHTPADPIAVMEDAVIEHYRRGV